MDTRYSAQDVVRCILCTTAEAPMYCEVCHIYLCDECVGKHLANKSQDHKVVTLKHFLSTPKCSDHPDKQCEFHCEQCDVPICSQCVITKHANHGIGDLMENFKHKQEVIRRDLEDLEKSIYPKCQTTAQKIPGQKADQKKHSQTLKSAINKQGEALHSEINTIIHGLHSEIDDYDTEHLAAINHQETVINSAMIEIQQVILQLKSLLDTSDVCLVSKYKSRNEEFRKMSTELHVTLPNFQPQEINRGQLLKRFVGSLTPLSIETEEQVYSLPSPGAESFPPNRPLLDVPSIIIELATGYDKLYRVSCLSDEEIWTSGHDKILKLYNLQGELVKSVKTKLGNWPWDIAVTRSGDLVYTDYRDRSINLVSDTQIQRLITLRGWGPLGLCSTSSGDLLVTMISDDYKQTKVVRYSGSTKKESIQWDDQGKPLCSSGFNIKHLTENRNGDICVADFSAGAVVVVSAAGKLRFRYTGPPSGTKRRFVPLGITTDSQGKILTADRNNHCIHVVDQDGHFLRYIDNCGLQSPWGLCVDSIDNLFVAEALTGKVKKIQYYK